MSEMNKIKIVGNEVDVAILKEIEKLKNIDHDINQAIMNEIQGLKTVISKLKHVSETLNNDLIKMQNDNEALESLSFILMCVVVCLFLFICKNIIF